MQINPKYILLHIYIHIKTHIYIYIYILILKSEVFEYLLGMFALFTPQLNWKINFMSLFVFLVESHIRINSLFLYIYFFLLTYVHT